MTFPTPGTEYWNNKFAAFMHDPFDKVFEIPGHESRAAKLIEQFGLDMPNDKFWKAADAMAAGFERGQVPTYSKDENKNGAVNFAENPILTHPISNTDGIKIEFSEKFKKMSSETKVKFIYEELLKSIKEYIGQHDDQSGYSGRFQGEPDVFGFWHRIPADSRFPDHSIWQHNALTSAFYSCMELANSKDEVGMMVFSITPVQAFINKARKLRDYWTGSVVLSWLAFEGIQWICENLGSDHVLYPSLIDQPLINEYLESTWKMDPISRIDSFSLESNLTDAQSKSQ